MDTGPSTVTRRSRKPDQLHSPRPDITAMSGICEQNWNRQVFHRSALT